MSNDIKEVQLLLVKRGFQVRALFDEMAAAFSERFPGTMAEIKPVNQSRLVNCGFKHKTICWSSAKIFKATQVLVVTLNETYAGNQILKDK